MRGLGGEITDEEGEKQHSSAGGDLVEERLASRESGTSIRTREENRTITVPENNRRPQAREKEGVA